jgi:hypothetical protein
MRSFALFKTFIKQKPVKITKIVLFLWYFTFTDHTVTHSIWGFSNKYSMSVVVNYILSYVEAITRVLIFHLQS